MKSLGAKTLLFPTPVLLVGSYDDQEKPNLATVAWGGICCGSPPCLTISLRKATYSYGSIMARKAYTVSIPSVAQAREADYVGIYSGRDEEKFAAVGWTPVRSELVDAPYVKECSLVVECKVIHTLEIGLHTQFIGEILDVKAHESILDDKDAPSVAKMRPFSFSPSDRGYYAIGEAIGQAFSLGKKK